MVNHMPKLPPELWLIIFRLATSSPITYPSDSESAHYYYEPFQSHHETITALSDAALRDKWAITLVCRQWHALAGDMRYEDIRIGHGIAALHAALSEPAAANSIVNGITDTDTNANTNTSSESPPPSRHRVRRAVLPYAYTATPTSHAPPALALLALLPHLEVLVRPPLPPLSLPSPSQPPSSSSHSRTVIPIPTASLPSPSSPRFDFPTAAPALPALRRLEWAFDETGAASRAGGINSLRDTLIAAPNLSELVLTGPIPFTGGRCLSLPALRALHFQAGAGKSSYLMFQITPWVMPMLDNIIVEGEVRAAVLEILCVTFGRQVRVMELELGRGMSMNELGAISRICPALEEINLRIDVLLLDNYSPMDPSRFVHLVFFMHDALQRLGLYVDLDVREWSVETWMALPEFVAQWKGCPALHQVVLYVRNVEIAEQNPQFHLFREELSLSGRLLLLHSVRTLE